ncbi:MAG: hypothetical protein COB03_11710 [Alteromonas sp.]|nr:MAG: hypothetical protein COB03_11710 [Alteromonas sp.]
MINNFMGLIIKFFVLSIFYLGLIFNVNAANEDGSFAIKGIGSSTCSRYLDLMQAGESEAVFQFGGWMNGYISASNEFHQDTFDLVSFEEPDTLLVYVTKYCRAYPSHRFLFAVKAILKSFSDNRVKQNSKMITFPGQSKLKLYEETIDWIAGELKSKGFIEHPLPSLEDIKKALVKFQIEQGIDGKGEPTQQTLIALLRRHK